MQAIFNVFNAAYTLLIFNVVIGYLYQPRFLQQNLERMNFIGNNVKKSRGDHTL